MDRALGEQLEEFGVRPGLLGYHYRVLEKAFRCGFGEEGPSHVSRFALFVYEGLPHGLAMVEYLRPDPLEFFEEPELSAIPPSSESVIRFQRAKTQTLLYLYATGAEAFDAVERLLSTGEVEALLIRYGLDIDEAKLKVWSRRAAVIWVQPGSVRDAFYAPPVLVALPEFFWALDLFAETVGEE